MRHLAAALAAAALAALAAGCGSSGSGQPGPTHADRLACRTVWREWGVYQQFGTNGIGVMSPLTAGEALTHSVQTMRSEQLVTNPAIARPLARDMRTAAGRLPGLTTTHEVMAALVPAEHDCRALGITAGNAENTGGGS
jgi:hypothetical protein